MSGTSVGASWSLRNRTRECRTEHPAQRSKAFCPHELAVSCDVHAIFHSTNVSSISHLSLLPSYSVHPQLYKVVEILLNDGSGYFLNAGTIIVDISPLPENTHSRLTTIPLSTVISISQPISEGAGANSAGYFPPNAAAAVAALPYFMFLFSQKNSS